ncbi:short-subunit dehydrogenase [Balneicella halophila]|uniref:Short-subunit dehydrogenase n=1 Tax=Balneicella halophila TaxID=1537566 RepID=A0A7L4UNF2_BALHA|nr:SDR family oxidoreductase [Balneicella halophila]PVX50086.1 short-subunit dehydrogenase [Balneicella halophila]
MKDKVVIITGASSGIGKACAIECANRQAKVVLAARNIKKLKEVEQSILESKGYAPLCIETDVTKESDCKKLIEKTIAHYGEIHILINNAGIAMRALFKDVELDVLRNIMNVNFWGTVYCTKYALPYLLKTKGSVVGVISVAGYMGLPGRTGYGASKFAVRGFLETLRVENLKTGLHVLVAAPGFTASNIRNTSLTASGKPQGKSPRDEGKMMSAEECAKHIINATVKRKRELILTFAEGKFTVWLSKWFPSLLDKLSYNHMAKEPDSPFK